MRLAALAALTSSLALGPAAAAPDEGSRRDAHEAVRAALTEGATLPSRDPFLPELRDAAAPDARADRARHAEAERRAAHERAAQRGEQHRRRAEDRAPGAGDGAHRGGMRQDDSAGECRDAAGAVRTREMRGGMDGGGHRDGPGPGDGPRMDGR